MEWIEGIRSAFLTGVMKGFTFLGDEEFFLLFLPLAFWLWAPKRMARLGILLLATVVINDFLKGIFQIPRPETISHLVAADGWNVPSGHAQSAMVMWGWLAYEFRKPWGYFLALLLILGIGFSRMYLGVHDLTAVAAGFAVGLLSLILYAWLIKRSTTGWRSLGPSRQSLVIFVILLAAYMVFPDYHEPAIKGGAAFIGFTAGVLHSRRYLPMTPIQQWSAIALRGLIGLIGLLVIYVGLKQIFAAIGYQTTLSTFIRYTLLGAWISYGAPYFFLHFHLSEAAPRRVR